MSIKKICFFNSSRTWGGGEKWHFDMALRMNHGRFKTYVVAGINSELSLRLKKSPIPFDIASVSNLSFLNPIKIYRIYKILKREQIHAIIINLSEDVKAAGLASKLAGVKHIIYRRGSAIPIRNNLLNRILFKWVLTEVIANSQQTKKTIIQNNQRLFPMDKIKVIYNGICIDSPEDAENEPLHDRQNGEVVLGNAGRLVAQKGQKYLIEIAKQLKDRNVKFKLLIAGEGKCLDQLKQLVIKHDVQNEVIFLGYVRDMNHFMKNIDIFLLPSLWEGFGYVIVEAMAACKPVIAFDISSNPEIIQNDETGYLIEEMDINSFTEKIEFLSRNKLRQKEMGLAGRKRIERLFRIERTCRELGEFIDALK